MSCVKKFLFWCFRYNVDSNEKDSQFKIGDQERISKQKNLFAKDMLLIGQTFFFISKTKNAVPWSYILNDLNGKEIVRTFYEKELQKTNQKELRIEKVIKRR